MFYPAYYHLTPLKVQSFARIVDFETEREMLNSQHLSDEQLEELLKNTLEEVLELKDVPFNQDPQTLEDSLLEFETSNSYTHEEMHNLIKSSSFVSFLYVYKIS